LFRTKSVEDILHRAESHPGGVGLVRRLGPVQLLLMGVGVIIGAGIFVITGSAAALFAGPSITLSFLLAALGCSFAALCYAEFASLMPVSGSAYTYAYATLGELTAWIIGWNLIMEYVFAASYVAVGWSGYAASLLSDAGVLLPKAFVSAPLSLTSHGLALTGSVLNLPAVAIILAVTMVARRGIGMSAAVNAAIVVLKVGVLLLFLLFGAQYVSSANWTPFIPANTGEFGHYGLSGILRGAAVVFVAYLGFDAVSTTAQETVHPQRNLPIGILGSLLICTLLYMAVSLVLTGLTAYPNLDAPNPLSVALHAAGGGLDWLVPLVDVAAICGLASVLLVIVLAQARILLAMGRDGLLPGLFAAIHPRFRTPSRSTELAGAAVALLSGLFPIDVLVQLVSLGTLSIFIAVCVGVVILRRTRPGLPRAFRTPFSPALPITGAIVCLYLLFGLPRQTWVLYGGWSVVGAIIYFGYGRRSATRLHLQHAAAET
jgi:APA family basic amino acid/polyamine antiporter